MVQPFPVASGLEFVWSDWFFCNFLCCVGGLEAMSFGNGCVYWNGQVQNERSIAEAEALPHAVRASSLGGWCTSKGPVINF